MKETAEAVNCNHDTSGEKHFIQHCSTEMKVNILIFYAGMYVRLRDHGSRNFTFS